MTKHVPEQLLVFPLGGYPYSKQSSRKYLAAVKQHSGLHTGWEMFDNKLFYWWAMFKSKADRIACAKDLKRQGFTTTLRPPRKGSNVNWDKVRSCPCTSRT